MKVQKFNEFYNRAAGYKYSEPTESHNKYIIHFALKWRISRSTLESLLNDALVELEIFKYTLEVDLLEEDIFDIVIKLNSYSDKEAAFFMEKIVDFFPEEIEFSDIYFGSEEPVENTKRSIGYKRSNESILINYQELKVKIEEILKKTTFDKQEVVPSTISIYDSLVRKDFDFLLIDSFVDTVLEDIDSFKNVVRFKYQCIEDFIYDIDLTLGLSGKTEKELVDKLTKCLEPYRH